MPKVPNTDLEGLAVFLPHRVQILWLDQLLGPHAAIQHGCDQGARVIPLAVPLALGHPGQLAEGEGSGVDSDDAGEAVDKFPDSPLMALAIN